MQPVSELDTTQVYVFSYASTDRMLYWDTAGWHEEFYTDFKFYSYPWNVLDLDKLEDQLSLRPNYSIIPTGPCGQCDSPARLSDYLCSSCRDYG